MSKLIKFFTYIAVMGLLIIAFFVSMYVYAFSKSVTDRFSAGLAVASYGKFYVIKHNLDEMGDLKKECRIQLGNGFRIADWNDIVTFYKEGGSLDEFIKGLKFSEREDMKDPLLGIRQPTNSPEASDTDKKQSDLLANEYRITKDGQLRWDGDRHYFVGRHDHSKPPGFLAHEQINDYQLSLGSWHGTGGYALCYSKLTGGADILNKILNFITNFFTILFIGCLQLIVVLISMKILQSSS